MRFSAPLHRAALIAIALLSALCAPSSYADSHASAPSHPLDVAMLGDSNTWIGGDDSSKPRGWNHWFVKLIAPRSARSYARSGATWSHTPATVIDPDDSTAILSDRNVIAAQIERLRRDIECRRTTVPNLIIISAGTNDAMFPRRRPSALTASQAADNPLFTVAGAVADGIARLKNLAPDATIVVLTPIQCVKIAQTPYTRITDIIDSAARQAGAMVVRQDYDALISAKAEARKRNLTYDGIHTSAAGAEKVARNLIAALAPILPSIPLSPNQQSSQHR